MFLNTNRALKAFDIENHSAGFKKLPEFKNYYWRLANKEDDYIKDTNKFSQKKYQLLIEKLINKVTKKNELIVNKDNIVVLINKKTSKIKFAITTVTQMRQLFLTNRMDELPKIKGHRWDKTLYKKNIPDLSKIIDQLVMGKLDNFLVVA